jgi:hypothetical protein
VDDLLCLGVLLVVSLIVGIWFRQFERHGKRIEKWIGSAPTILPWDDNPNPIKFHINDDGMPEWYREID